MAITVTFQPDATAGKDAKIRANAATTNYGTTTDINVGANDGSGARVSGLIDFTEIVNIPRKAKIISAKVGLYYYNAWTGLGSISLLATPLLRNWTEAGVTWNTYDGTNAWATAGATGNADIDKDIGHLIEFPDRYSSYGWRYFYIADITFWKQWNRTYYGWLLYYIASSEHVSFYSSDYTTDITLRPKLIITYEPYHKIYPVKSSLGQVK